MIIYFSGTGNTRRCAILLAERLEDAIHELSPEELLAPDTVELPISSDEKRIIWAFPTYSWGMPPVVEHFIMNVKGGTTTSVSHYMLTTCGDDMALTDRQWRRLIEKRGWTASRAYSVIMPNTYVLMKGFDVDSREVAETKVEAAPARIADIAESIVADSDMAQPLTRGSFAAIKSKVIYPWFRRFAMSPKPFHCTEGCTGCGLCARQCTMANITMLNRRPSWGERCAMCLRCYHICPRHAVAYGNKTNSKGQQMLK